MSVDDELDPLLRREVDAWRASTPAAPARLRARLLDAVASSAGQTADVIPMARDGLAGRRLWLAAAAAVAALAVLILWALPDRVDSIGGRLVVADALEEVRAAERAHARAIARLESAAVTVLARAHDPSTAPALAARLLDYGSRLASLDTAIARVRAHLDDNPGLASARTVLLAAYLDKTQLLEELLQEHGDV